MIFTGGTVNFNFDNILFPTADIVSGGRVGLILGIAAGILASFAQMRLWIVPSGRGAKTLSERKGLFLVLSVASVVYDVASTYYFMNKGNWITPGGLADNIIGSLFMLAITMAMFSVGPVITIVWGIETVIQNHTEGMPSLATGIETFVSTVGKFLASIIGGVVKVFQWEHDGETEEIPQSVPAVAQTRGRGRPPRIYQEEREDNNSL